MKLEEGKHLGEAGNRPPGQLKKRGRREMKVEIKKLQKQLDELCERNIHWHGWLWAYGDSKGLYTVVSGTIVRIEGYDDPNLEAKIEAHR